MKILFVPLPGIGHAFPMVPLAWALRTAGHDITFLAGFDGVEIRNAGIPVVEAIPAGTSMMDDFADVLEEAPDIFESMAHLTNEEILGLKPMVVRPWDRYVDGYVKAAVEQRPDLIVYDPVFSAGMVAASLLDVPAIGHGYMLIRFTPDFLREHAADAFERHNADLPRRLATVEIGPPSLMEAGSSTWDTQYIPYNGGSVLPEWLGERPQRPRVAISLGTPLPHRSSAGRFDRILAAAAEVDAEFALTVNEATASTLSLPDNVRATGWVPLFNLLQTCSAVIHHGGSGTMFTTAVSGLPQMIIPEGADNDYNARLLRDFGCGLHVGPKHVSAEHIRTLLDEPALRDGAVRLRAEMTAMRTPAAVVPEIVAFARGER